MDIQREIEREHSKKMALKVAQYVGNNPKRFAELVHVFLDGPDRITQRAAWPLRVCVELHPSIANAHLRTLISSLHKNGQHAAVKRNVLRLLQYVFLPKRLYGSVADICFETLQKKDEPVATKVFAMSVLVPIVQHLPELKTELRIVLEDQLPYGSPGFISRAKKVLKQISNN